MKNSTKIWLLAGILILASFLRLYHITETPPGLYPDEAMDGNNALEVIQTGHFQPFYVEDNGREGLYVNILVFFIQALGNKPWVVRLPAAIAGILTVLGMYFLVKELWNVECDTGNVTEEKNKKFSIPRATFSGSLLPLLAAFLLATSFWHINFSRIGFRAILAPLCLTWALYWFLKAMRSDKENVNKSMSHVTCCMSLVYAVLAGIIFGAGFYTYIAYRVSPLLFLLFIPFFRTRRDFWKKTALFLLVTFIVALPIGIYFVQHPADFFGRTSEISVTTSANPLRDLAVNVAKTALMFNIHGDNNWRQNISGAPELWWPVGILFLLGILYGIYVLWQGRGSNEEVDSKTVPRVPCRMSQSAFPILLIFSWFLLGGLPAVISDEGIPHALRSILMLPPAIMLAAVGGLWLYDRLSSMGHNVRIKKVINVLAILFIVAVACNAYYSYFIVWAQNPNVPGAFNADYVAIGDQMNALPLGTPKYVVVDAGGVLARGIPVPAETVMFVTDSFTTSTRLANHITYLLPNQTSQIPAGTPSSTIFYVN